MLSFEDFIINDFVLSTHHWLLLDDNEAIRLDECSLMSVRTGR